MATMYYSGKSQNSISVYTTLDPGGNRTGLTFKWWIREQGGSFNYSSEEASNASSLTYYKTYYNLTPARTYDMNCEIYENGSRIADLYVNGITTDAPPTPSQPYNLSASSTTNGYAANIYWTNGANTDHVVVQINGYSYTVYGSSYTTPNILSRGQQYYYTVTPYNSSGYSGSNAGGYVTTNNVPAQVTGITVDSQHGKHFNLYWNATSGSNGYKVYKSTDGSNYVPAFANNSYDAGNVTSAQVSVDYEWQNYWFQVTAYNSTGDAPNYYTPSGTKSRDDTNPIVNSIYSSTPATSDTIYAYAQVQDVNPSAGTQSGVKIVHWYKDGTLITSNAPDSGGNAYNNFTNLDVNKTYTIACTVEDNDGNISPQKSYPETTKYSRPPNWNWYTAKNSGANFNVTASEWNDFTKRINDFRQWHNSVKASGLGAYSFTTAGSATVFPAYMFNQAVTAIGEMSPPTAVPASQSTGNRFYASLLNDLMNSLNSLN